MKRMLMLCALLGALSIVHGQEKIPMQSIPVPDLHAPRDGLLSGGQPEPADWVGIAQRGVTMVVNLRPDAELPGRDEAAEVAAAGMAYRHIPVDGAAGLTLEKARQLRELLADANGTVLVHCASGNRAGALIALAAADAGATPEEALAQGRAAGMTGTEARVRELIGMPAQP